MNIRETYEQIIAKAAEDAYNNGYQRGYDAGHLAGQTEALVSVYKRAETGGSAVNERN
jgi:flagellar biosynthesis/type III secretory pathway protein FliH